MSSLFRSIVLSFAVGLVPVVGQAALSPKNECGRGNKIVSSWVCADAKTGGAHALGAFVICSQKEDGKNVGYTSKLDDNVVAYGGGYFFGTVISDGKKLVISKGGEFDSLDLKTGLAHLQHEKMKCTPTVK